MSAEHPYVFGIAGASGSGKTALAHAVAERLGADLSVVLPLDAYYHDLSDIPPAERAQHNFDSPDAIDWMLFRTQLAALLDGRSVERPIYNYATHTRLSDSIPIEPAAFLLVDGLLALVAEPVRAKMQTKVFVVTPDDVCLERRIARDVSERGRTRESVVQQFEQTVKPMFEQHVAPTRQYADVIVRGDRPLELAVEAVVAHVRSSGLGSALHSE